MPNRPPPGRRFKSVVDTSGAEAVSDFVAVDVKLPALVAVVVVVAELGAADDDVDDDRVGDDGPWLLLQIEHVENHKKIMCKYVRWYKTYNTEIHSVQLTTDLR